jgi:gamma-glutamylcyclotransferase (GGCT)/AIG2-like uncharacterized protein YtfP
VYGSLRQGFGLPDLPEELTGMLADDGPCVIAGDLYDLGDYPGLCELFRILDPQSAFPLLDKYERFDASAPQESLYIRHCVRLLKPEIDAWIYIYNGTPDNNKKIESGDWAAYVSGSNERAGSD